MLQNKNSAFTTLLPQRRDSEKQENGLIRQKEASLRTAAQFGQMEAVSQLLDAHAVDPNAADEDTLETALHRASKMDHIDVVKILMRRGADPLRTNVWEETAIHASVDGDECRCLSYFLDNGFDTLSTDEDGLNVWQLAALRNDKNALKLLFSNETLKDALRKKEAEGRQMPMTSCAAKGGFVDVLSMLLVAGFDIFGLDEKGWTALHHAARAGSPQMIKRLMSQGLDVGALTADGSNVIHLAVTGEDADDMYKTLEILLERGLNPFMSRQDGSTPMDLLIMRGSNDMIDSTEEKVLMKLAYLPNSFQSKQEAILKAIRRIPRLTSNTSVAWDLRCLRILIKNCADLTGSSSEGPHILSALFSAWKNAYSSERFYEKYSDRLGNYLDYFDGTLIAALELAPTRGALHDICADPAHLLFAIKNADDEVIIKLLERGADVDQRTDDETSTLIGTACAMGCSREIIKRLLGRSKASTDHKLGSILILEACRNGHDSNYQVLLELLEAGLPTNGVLPNGQTALMLAAKAKNARMIEELLVNGCDVDATDVKNLTVAHYACASGNLDVVRSLEDSRIDWGARSDGITILTSSHEQMSMLHYVSSRPVDRANVLEYLLDRGLCKDVNCTDIFNETPLHFAARADQPQNVAFLLSRNADPTLCAIDNSSAIHLAAIFDSTYAMEAFIKHGCDLGVKDGEGLDCEMLALRHDNPQLAKKIRDYLRARSKRFPNDLECHYSLIV